jgi:hypothetical protein
VSEELDALYAGSGFGGFFLLPGMILLYLYEFFGVFGFRVPS